MKTARKLILIVLTLLFCFKADAQMSDHETIAKFVEGNTSYKNGQYKSAIAAYEAIVFGQKESANLYFNLGNSYFKTGALGKAILNYERALNLSPRDSDIRFNHTYTKSQTKNGGHSEPGGFLQRILITTMNFYTTEELFLIGVTGMFILGGFLLLAFFLKWERRVKLTISVIGVIVIFVSLGLFAGKIIWDKNQAIVLKETEAKFEPNQDSTTYFPAYEGLKVRIIKKSDGWYKVKRSDGKTGWINQDRLEAI